MKAWRVPKGKSASTLFNLPAGFLLLWPASVGSICELVELSRDYIAPPSDTIGRNSERELLVTEMRRDMNAAILRRIDAALRASGAAKAP